MKACLAAYGRLATLRDQRVRQVQGRLGHQRQLCQRYRANIDALNRLCGFEACLDTPVQRHNHQQYKATLHAMINLQVRELALAEATLQRVHEQLRVAMRSERVMRDALHGKWQEWQTSLARQEQRLQDGLGAQVWWRQRLAAAD